MSGFPGGAKISALGNKRRGHQGADYTASYSYIWSVPYLLHRTNSFADRRTYRCGDLSRERLVEGARRYNGGGDPRYRPKIEEALRLIGDIEAMLPGLGARVEAADGFVAEEGVDDLRKLVHDVLSELAETGGGEAAGSRVLFPGGVQFVRVRLTAGTAEAPVVREIEIVGSVPPVASAGAIATSVAEAAPPEIDFHEDPELQAKQEFAASSEAFEAFIARATAASEPSGKVWVGRFRGSSSTADLDVDFKEPVERCLVALAAAGAAVRISATYRPPERAYLVHHAWNIARTKSGKRPSDVRRQHRVGA